MATSPDRKGAVARGSGHRSPRPPRRLGLVLLATAALALGSSACMATSPAREPLLACRLEAEPPLLAGGPARVRLTLVNEGSEPLAALVWNTPFEGAWLGTPFTVTRDGVALEYGGAMVKRGDPEADDYVQLGAGESRSAEADLAAVYPLAAAGGYEVRVTGTLADLAPAGAAPRPRAEHRAVPLDCPPLRFELAAP